MNPPEHETEPGADDLERFRARLNRIAKRTEKVEETSKATAREAEFHLREVKRISPQLAALHSVVEDLRQALETAPSADDEQLRETRELVELVRREHEQVRVRLSAVTRYEERLRRIEEMLDLPHE